MLADTERREPLMGLFAFQGVEEGPVGFAGVEQGSDPVVVEVGEPEGGAFDTFGQIDCWRPRSRRW